MSRAAALLLALAAAAPVASALEPIEDHRDQWGLTAALGTTYDTAVILSNQKSYSPNFLPMVEVGGSWAVTDSGDEVTLRLRFVVPTAAMHSQLDLMGLHGIVGPSLLTGWRGYFGYEAFKTFFAADLMGSSAPFWGGGAHGGFGAQYDFGRTGGLFAQLGFGATIGTAFLTSFDGQVGGQIRF